MTKGVRPWFGRLASYGFIVAVGLLSVGCQALGLYGNRCPGNGLPANRPLSDFAAGRPIDTKRLFASDLGGKDGVLYQLERGRIAQMVGDYETSRAAFEMAIAATRKADEAARVRVGAMGSQTAAMILNDNMIPYECATYERIMLRQFQAINYLALGDLEGAGVEVRNASFEQAQALQARERRLAAVREEAAQRGVAAPEATPGVREALARMELAAGPAKSSFQNAYTFYFSGVIREMLGEPDGAYIDYKKALEMAPGNPFVQRDALRLARSLGMGDELALLAAAYPEAAREAKAPAASSGSVIVLFEDGQVQQKIGISILIPLYHGMTAASFPIYADRWREPRRLTIRSSTGIHAETVPLCSLSSMAVRELQETYPAILLRMTVRSTVKGVAAAAVSHRDHDAAHELVRALAEFCVLCFNLMTEVADIRSWISLPDSAQVARLELPPGDQFLSFGGEGAGAPGPIKLAIRPRQIHIIRVIRVGDRFEIQQLWPAGRANRPGGGPEHRPGSQ